jgi:hypothetical protein
VTDQPNDSDILREIIANTERAAFLIGQLEAMDCPLVEKTAALLTAATTLIEREVGRTMGPAALAALLAPTLAEWAASAAGETVQ